MSWHDHSDTVMDADGYGRNQKKKNTQRWWGDRGVTEGLRHGDYVSQEERLKSVLTQVYLLLWHTVTKPPYTPLSVQMMVQEDVRNRTIPGHLSWWKLVGQWGETAENLSDSSTGLCLVNSDRKPHNSWGLAHKRSTCSFLFSFSHFFFFLSFSFGF